MGYQAFKIAVLLRWTRERFGLEEELNRLKPEELGELLRRDGGDMEEQ
jgi:hypothetical protein